MRQVLLAPRQPVRWNGGMELDVRDPGRPRPPVLLWMDDGTHVGDAFVWQGGYWEVSAVYGTHFSTTPGARRRDRPRRHREDGNGLAVPIDR